MIKTLAFASQAGMGKDTCADYVFSKLKIENNWKRASFAQGVKEVYCDYFNKDTKFIESWKRIKDCPPGMTMPVRESLQFIGDGFRKINPDVWVDRCFSKHKNEDIILSDVRYISEAKAIKNRGGINVLLFRPDYLNDDPNLSESQIRPFCEWCAKTQVDGAINFNKLNPPSAIGYFDYFINNNGTIEELYEKLDRILLSDRYFI